MSGLLRSGMAAGAIWIGIAAGAAAHTPAGTPADAATTATTVIATPPPDQKQTGTPAVTPTVAPAPPRPTPPPAPAGINLLPNGSFDRVVGNQPENWEMAVGGSVSILIEPVPHGQILRLDASRAVAGTSGVKFRSEPVQAEVGRGYRLKLEARTSGIAALVWVRGYGEFNGKERELYNFKKEIKFEGPNVWTPLESVFTVREPVGAAALARRGKTVPRPERMRVELFCFGADAGQVDFDTISLTPMEIKAPETTPVAAATPAAASATTPAPTVAPAATPAASTTPAP